MIFFNKLFRDLFGGNDKPAFGDQGTLIKERIKHNQTFLNNYKDWLNKKVHIDLMQNIYLMWAQKIKDEQIDVNLFLHKSNLSNGFYIRREEQWNTDDYCFFIYFIIEKLQVKEYVLNNTSREVIEEGGLLKTIELFYLKPSLKHRKQAPFEQFFGSLEIQHRMVNGETTVVKLLANTYSDRRYKKAYDFEDLMNYIFVL